MLPTFSETTELELACMCFFFPLAEELTPCFFIKGAGCGTKYCSGSK